MSHIRGRGFAPPACLHSSIALFIPRSRSGAVNHARPSRLVCRKFNLVTFFEPSIYSLQLCRTRAQSKAPLNALLGTARGIHPLQIQHRTTRPGKGLSLSRRVIDYPKKTFRIVSSTGVQRPQQRSGAKSVSWTTLSRTSLVHFS